MDVGRRPGVPVLMFHSVRPANLVQSPLSLPVERFLRNLEAASRRGYRTVTLQQLYDHKASGAELPEKPLVITFDDGFMDNWVFAHPVLERLGMCATVFPTVDFIGEGPPRKRWPPGDASALNGFTAEDCSGSLRWSELELMKDSGVFDVQSHTMTHGRVFCGPAVEDFVRTGRDPLWLRWNIHPRGKPFLLEGGDGYEAPVGYPVLENGRALGVIRFIPDPEPLAELVKYVAGNGGPAFFNRHGWRERLLEMVAKGGVFPGRFETPDEHRERVAWELSESRRKLEKRLGIQVRFLCWPGGARTATALSLVRECGYLASTCPSSLAGSSRNRQDPGRIVRVGSCSRWSFRDMGGFVSPECFADSLDRYRGSLPGALSYRVRKSGYVLKSLLTRRKGAGSHGNE